MSFVSLGTWRRNFASNILIYLRIVVSVDADVVALVPDDLRVSVGASRSGEGGGHEESEDDELYKEETYLSDIIKGNSDSDMTR